VKKLVVLGFAASLSSPFCARLAIFLRETRSLKILELTTYEAGSRIDENFEHLCRGLASNASIEGLSVNESGALSVETAKALGSAIRANASITRFVNEYVHIKFVY